MRRRLLLTSPLLLLGACAEPPLPDVAPDGFGLAVRHNIEAQIANPDHEIETLGPAPGVRRALAADRYQTDQVDAPIAVLTRGD
jgi:hypothetical protein